MEIKKIYDTYMKNKGNEQKYLYDYYMDEKDVVPVYTREKKKTVTSETTYSSADEAIHVNYFADIITRKVGYMGSQIDISSSDEKLNELIKEFNGKTKQKTENIESISDTSVTGISHRLIYTENGEIKIKNIMGWQIVYDYTDDIFNPTYAYYFYSTFTLEGKEVKHCDIYDTENVTYTVLQKTNNSMSYNVIATQPHNFNVVPIIPFLNNNNWLGDCNNAINMMNNYDIIMSDTADDLKATRLMYLKVWGNLYTGQDSEGNDISLADWLIQGRAMIFGSDDDGKQTGDAQFLSKSIDDTAVEHMLDRIRGHIYEVSSSVDLKQLTDNSDTRVFAIQAALSRLETNASITEQYFRMGLNKQYSLFLYWLSEFNGLSYDISEVEIVFNRVFVKDKTSLADMLIKLMNVMSPLDAYKISELFDDPEAAVLRYEEYISGIPEGMNALEGE